MVTGDWPIHSYEAICNRHMLSGTYVTAGNTGDWNCSPTYMPICPEPIITINLTGGVVGEGVDMLDRGRRYVRLVVFDPDKRVSAEDALIYEAGPFMTDSDDDTLWMEYGANVLDALKEYNDRIRTTTPDGDRFLKPVKLSDVVRRVIVL